MEDFLYYHSIVFFRSLKELLTF